MERFSIATSDDAAGLGAFSQLPPELRQEILYHAAQGEFPIGAGRPHPILAASVATAQARVRGNDQTMAALYNLRDMRRHVRTLYALAATSKEWYMTIRREHTALFHVLVGYQYTFAWVPRAIRESTIPSRDCDACHLDWYVAATRLLLWPGLHRCFVGFRDGPHRRRDLIQTSLDSATGVQHGAFPLELMAARSRHSIKQRVFIHHYWVWYPAQCTEDRPPGSLPATVETILALADLDAATNTFTQECTYRLIVAYMHQRCQHNTVVPLEDTRKRKRQRLQ